MRETSTSIDSIGRTIGQRMDASFSRGMMIPRASRAGRYRVSVAHTYTRAYTESRHTHAHTSTNGDTENGWSGIEARLIVLDNSDASADATIPGRCWPGLADWLAGGSRGYISLSPSLCLLLLPFSLPFSLHPCHPRRYPRPVDPLFHRATLSSLLALLLLVLPWLLVVPFVSTPSLCLSTGSFLEMMRRFRPFFHFAPRRSSPPLALLGLSGVSSSYPPSTSSLSLSLPPVLSRYSVSRAVAILKV